MRLRDRGCGLSQFHRVLDDAGDFAHKHSPAYHRRQPLCSALPGARRVTTDRDEGHYN